MANSDHIHVKHKHIYSLFYGKTGSMAYQQNILGYILFYKNYFHMAEIAPEFTP